MHDCPIDPEDFVLSLFGYGTKKGREAETIQMHWIQGCPACLQAVLERAGLSSFAELAALRTPTLELPLLYGRREISSLVDWLVELPPSDREHMMKKDERLHRVAAVAEILARCRDSWGAAPEEALALSNLALALVEWVPESDKLAFFAGEKPDLRVRSLAYQGNVYRILGDLRQAEVSFDRAKWALKDCWLDHQVEAEMLLLKSSLLRAQRRFPAARSAIARSIELYKKLGAEPSLGKALLVSATVRQCCKDYEGLERDLDEAVCHLDMEATPRLEFVVAGQRLNLLWQTGRLEAASALLPMTAALAAKHGSTADRLQVRWCEAGILADQGRAAEAEPIYRSVRAAFLAAGSAYDLALISLDMAGLFLEQGRWAEIQKLAAEALPLFTCRDVHREALVAWQLFGEAAKGEALERATVERLRDYMKAARHDPSYRYADD